VPWRAEAASRFLAAKAAKIGRACTTVAKPPATDFLMSRLRLQGILPQKRAFFQGAKRRLGGSE